MGLRTALGLYTRPKFAGDWAYRLDGLFDCGVDFAGRTVLDAGCNMGIVDYEISKSGPAFIHGMDSYRGALKIAQAIFSAMQVESRFDKVDLLNQAKLRRHLLPAYDIVLLLAVYQHLRKASPEAAAQTIATLAERCRKHFVARVPVVHSAELISLLKRNGFQLISKTGETDRPVLRFDRAGAHGPA